MLQDLVTYDHKKKEYLVTAGQDIVAFPNGPTGKLLATRLAVFASSPAVYELASKLSKKYPALERRAWLAAELVIDGKLTFSPANDVLAQVDGGDPAGAYNVIALDGELACDCPDFAGGFAPFTMSGRRLCKHLIAYTFARKLYQETTQAATGPRYGDGSAVEPDLAGEWETYSRLYQRPPQNRTALVSWIYR